MVCKHVLNIVKNLVGIEVKNEDLKQYPGEWDEEVHDEWVFNRIALRNFKKSLSELTEEEHKAIEEALKIIDSAYE